MVHEYASVRVHECKGRSHFMERYVENVHKGATTRIIGCHRHELYPYQCKRQVFKNTM